MRLGATASLSLPKLQPPIGSVGSLTSEYPQTKKATEIVSLDIAFRLANAPNHDSNK